jgi:hypothetical protein
MSDNSSVTQRNLSELSDMIRLENDQDKRSILLVCQGLMSELAQLTHILDGMRREHSSRINDHEVRLETHCTKIEAHTTIADKAQTMLRVCIFMVTLSSGGILAAGKYAYTSIADLRDRVTQHEIQLNIMDKAPR